MTVDRNSRLTRSDSPVETVVGTEIVLMVLDSGKIYGLGETGSEVWRLLDKPTSVQPIVEALCQVYDAPAETIERDVLELLEELHERELIQVS